MTAVGELLTENIGAWTEAVKPKASAGRGGGSGVELYGVKKLRELILDLAVRGLLVPQDRDEEPASELLLRVESAMVDMVEEGAFKKPKPLPEISDDEHAYQLPAGWAWVKLGHIMEMFNGRAFKQSEWSSIGLPIVRIQNLNDEAAPFNFYNGELADHHRIDTGDFLISWSGTPGTSFGAFVWNRGEGALNQHINKCVIFGSELNRMYLKLAVNSCMGHLISHAQGGVGLKHVTKGTLNNTIFALPPLSEQHRIVAKVDELMHLCDQLESQQSASLEAHRTLVSTLLEALTKATEREGFEAAWSRIAEHFDILFTTEWSVDQLKQTILQLAVMGKLVPQLKGDQPAVVLLTEIDKQRRQTSKGKLIGEQSNFPAIEASELSIGLPVGWARCRLVDVGYSATGKTPKTSNSRFYGGQIPFIGPGQVSVDGEILEADKTLTDAGLAESTEALPGDILMVCIGGSIGKTAVAHRRLSFNQQINMLRPILTASSYIYIAVRSPEFQRAVIDASTGSATPIINRGKWDNLLINLPPLEEQRRIAAKVEELMTVCDQLKSAIHASQKTQVLLAGAITEQAVAEPARGV